MSDAEMSSMSTETSSYKVKELSGGSAWKTYRSLYYGDAPLSHAIKSEALNFLFGATPGAPGLALRKVCYPTLFALTGRGVVFGRNLTLRHTHKIRLGNKSILDDGAVLDAKGDTNQGITIGDNVYIGRNTIIYTKNGNIRIGDNVNISANCQIFSCGDLEIGAGTMIAAFCYILNGGSYDISANALPFAKQSGMESKGATRIGQNCWLAAHATITDGVQIGEHCVIGAGSVVLHNQPAHTFAAGSPARTIRNLIPSDTCVCITPDISPSTPGAQHPNRSI
jgi:acetyltransferase-like isoleucine patch superfamily enzyme